MHGSRSPSRVAVATGVGGPIVALACALAVAEGDVTPMPVVTGDIKDFKLPGSQPESLYDDLVTSDDCSSCHSSSDPAFPYARWSASIMGQASRDPIFLACLDIANYDVKDSGDLCIRCHVPIAWLNGRSEPTDGSAFLPADPTEGTGDRDGVSCSICHRMIDPVMKDAAPLKLSDGTLIEFSDVDQIQVVFDDENDIPNALSRHSGTYVVDIFDFRRGPYLLADNHGGHDWGKSPFHTRSELCGTCHDVSNPAYRLVDGAYTLVADKAPHPTQNKYEMFPIERTFSEWSKSEFAQRPIEMNGRFDPKPGFTKVSTCQSCHMPRAADNSIACDDAQGVPTPRNDIGMHNFNGVNSWVLSAIGSLDYDGDGEADFPESVTGLSAAAITDAFARTKKILEEASDMVITQEGCQFTVRVYNNSGHKLPTGYPEGRRMWLEVDFYDENLFLIHDESLGHYDEATAELDGAREREFNTKVYEAVLGIDETIATATGLNDGEAGHTFHFVLNNVYLKDNRIPPRGFTNDGFASVQAAPVVEEGDPFATHYTDGQYWDDTTFDVPFGAVAVHVRLRSQTTTKEYIEFLRDTNPNRDRDPDNNRGQVAYDAWVAAGRSKPIDLDSEFHVLVPCGGPGAGRWYVDDDAGGKGDGSSWADAFTRLDDAFDAAQSGDEVWVATGTYKSKLTETDTFEIPPGVRLYGGFEGGERELADRAGKFHDTILTGVGARPGDNAGHVVRIAGSGAHVIIDGFRIEKGSAIGRPLDNSGGGMTLMGTGDVTVRNCCIVDNTAEGFGGGVYNGQNGIVTFINCLFLANSGFNSGGALHTAGYARLINCTVSGNTGGALRAGAGGTIVMTNSIAWGNSKSGRSLQSGQILAEAGGAAIVNRCCIQGWDGTLGGVGNHGNDPAFFDPEGADRQQGTSDDNLRLSDGSPCIDQGNNAALPADVVKDLDHLARFVDDPFIDDPGGAANPTVDMGAYEFIPGLLVCLADINQDGDVDGADLAIMLSQWGPGSDLSGDIDGSGDVDAKDVAVLLASWGPCPI